LGRLLQVRVSASTVEPGKVEEAWPILCHLAYPPGNDYAPAGRGVLELVRTLEARISAGEVPGPVVARLSPWLGKAWGLAERFGEALAAWDVDKARRLSDEIEDALDDLEDRASYT
jgi:hypothetical protein